MVSRLFGRGKTLSQLYPDTCNLFDDLLSMKEELDHTLVRFHDVDQACDEVQSFVQILKECVDETGDPCNLFPVLATHARSASRFAARMDDSGFTDRLESFLLDLGKLPAYQRDHLLGVREWGKIEPFLPRTLRELVEYIWADWRGDKRVYTQALNAARAECTIDGVDDVIYYDWLAEVINRIPDYLNRVRATRAGWDYGRTQLAQLGRRFLRIEGMYGSKSNPQAPLHLYELHDTRRKTYVLVHYRGAIQIMNRQMTEVLGEWRDIKEFHPASPLAPAARIDDIPYWHYSPEQGVIVTRSCH